MENKKAFSQKFFKVVLMVALILVILFQTSSLAISYTNAEIKEMQRQERLIENLALNLTKDSSGYYLIQTAANARHLSNEIKNYGLDTTNLSFKQTANIDMSEVSYFYGIGTTSNPFKGFYDGQGYYVKNLFVSGDKRHKGFFGTVEGATIENVVVTSGSIQASAAGYYAGGVIAWIKEEDSDRASYVYNCYNLGCAISASNAATLAIGGVVGRVQGSGYTIVDGCFNSASVTHSGSASSAYAGGIIGYCSNTMSLWEHMNTGTIKAGVSGSTISSYAGGIVGYSSNTSMKYCLNKGSVYAYGKEQTSNGSRTKTLDYEVFENFSSSDSTVKELFLIRTDYTTTSKKYKDAYAGGICGKTNSTVSSCVNLGSTISGGYCQTTIKYEFIIARQASFSYNQADSITWWGEHYVIDFTEKILYSEKIARGPKENKDNYCNSYNGSSDFYSSTSFKLNATSNLYDARYLSNLKINGNTIKGYIFDPTTGEKIGSGFTDRGIMATLSQKTSSVYSNEYSGLNFIEHTTYDRNAYGTWPEDYPGFGSNKVKTSMSESIGARSFTIGYTYYVRTYKPGFWWWEEDINSKTTRDKSLKTISLPYRPTTATQLSANASLPSGLSSTYFAVDSSINSGYPYLKNFYWKYDTETPS